MSNSVSSRAIGEIARRLRKAAATSTLEPQRIRKALAEVGRRITDKAQRDGRTAAEIAERWGWAASSLPLRIVVEPLVAIADEQKSRFALCPRPELVGFFMPGNLPGAGLHEVAIALLAGRAVMIKTSSHEPVFFLRFVEILAEVDAQLAERVAVFDWPRERTDLTDAMFAECDKVVAFGDDVTIDQLAARSSPEKFFGFGARVSGIVLADDSSPGTINDVAQEVCRFEQRGCLSPHHIFISGGDSMEEVFAPRLASEIEKLSTELLPPPSRIDVYDAAAIRRVREQARWRAIGGASVRLWEGPIPGWTVIYDRDASFCFSPGYRTIFVSPFRDAADLQKRLAPVAGRLEAIGFGVGAGMDSVENQSLRAMFEGSGAAYICKPGRMQSPPLKWPHGGGAFLRSLCEPQ